MRYLNRGICVYFFNADMYAYSFEELCLWIVCAKLELRPLPNPITMVRRGRKWIINLSASVAKWWRRLKGRQRTLQKVNKLKTKTKKYTRKQAHANSRKFAVRKLVLSSTTGRFVENNAAKCDYLRNICKRHITQNLNEFVPD